MWQRPIRTSSRQRRRSRSSGLLWRTPRASATHLVKRSEVQYRQRDSKRPQVLLRDASSVDPGLSSPSDHVRFAHVGTTSGTSGTKVFASPSLERPPTIVASFQAWLETFHDAREALDVVIPGIQVETTVGMDEQRGHYSPRSTEPLYGLGMSASSVEQLERVPIVTVTSRSPQETLAVVITPRCPSLRLHRLTSYRTVAPADSV